MKTDYTALGREAMGRLLAASKQAEEVQEQLLFRLLKENRETEFGRKYDFSHITSIEAYQKKVPVSEYEDYSDYFSRIICGEENILTAQEAVYFCISSGTVGDEKYIPLTVSDLKIHYVFMYGGVFGQILDHYRGLDEKEIFGKIFQIGEFAKTYMPDGRMNGIRSTCVYQWLDKDDEFDASDYCVPKEVLFPDTLEDLLYVKVRFALDQRDLTAIHGVFINRVVGVMEYILQNWELLLRDMELGVVDQSVGLEDKWKRFLMEKLPPNPRRARELREIPKRELKFGAVKKIWNKMKYILSIGGESFSYYTGKMREYAGDIPIHFFIYAASEGVFGLAREVDRPDAYVLLPESVFFEFIPVDEEYPVPLLMKELHTGGKYELVITNQSGLYRYRLGDIVQVTEWFEKAPVVKFCYRRNQVINVAGEKSNQQQFEAAIIQFVSRVHMAVKGYCVQEDVRGPMPGYLFYMECDKIPDEADRIFEECMCRANWEYKSCRRLGEIAPLHIEFLREGSFKLYEQKLAQSGKRMAQNKMPHFLDTEEKKEFFAAQIVKGEGL